MFKETIIDQLVDARIVAWDAHTNQIEALLHKREDHDQVIKLLIDERRKVYQEFTTRIDATRGRE